MGQRVRIFVDFWNFQLTWKGVGNELAKACWASFEVDKIADVLRQP